MRIKSQASKLSNKPNLISVLDNSNQKNAIEMMCCRVGIVQTFYPDDLTADVLLVNKKTLGINFDGSQAVQNYALIRAKVCYCTPYETFPIKRGDECIVLFADRELESWFINGSVNPLGYERMHDETDALAIFGIRSLPKMIQILLDALHLFYGNSDIQLHPTEIITNTQTITDNATDNIEINTTDYELNAENQAEIKTDNYNLTAETKIELSTDSYTLDSETKITEETQSYTLTATEATVTIPQISVTGNTIQTGDITATNLNATAAASGTFISKDDKTITVVNGIITVIT